LTIPAFGTNWKNKGGDRPTKGDEITNEKLSEALLERQQFTDDEVKAFHLRRLEEDSFIKAGDVFFQQAIAQYDQPIAALCKRFTSGPELSKFFANGHRLQPELPLDIRMPTTCWRDFTEQIMQLKTLGMRWVLLSASPPSGEERQVFNEDVERKLGQWLRNYKLERKLQSLADSEHNTERWTSMVRHSILQFTNVGGEVVTLDEKSVL